MDRKAFTFLRSYYNQLKELDSAKRLKLYDALIEFALNGIEPTPFETLIERVVWEGIIATLRPSRQGWADKTGGVMTPPCQGGSEGGAEPPSEQKRRVKKSKEEKSERFHAPTIDEVIAYFKENGYTEASGRRAWEYYEAGNWKDGRGNQVKAWKQKMRGVWFKDENLAHKPEEADPWLEKLKKQKAQQ